MNRWPRAVTARGAGITLCLAGALLVGVSCRGNDVAGPTQPGAPVDASPELVIGAAQALLFRQISPSTDGNHTCGVTLNDRAYCWGIGYLGDGPSSQKLRPVAVAGGLRFRQVSSGYSYTCGVTQTNRAYCWGNNGSGQLGDGTNTDRPTPVPVAGGLRFLHVAAGGFHTCGLSTNNLPYCWGSNSHGQVGDGTTTDRPTPVPVAGGRRFRQVSTNFVHSCGVTTSFRAFCWGTNEFGRLGDGSTVRRRLVPTQVAGGRSFREVSAGWDHTCAGTTGNRAFCWGDGRRGSIGDGTTNRRLTPRAVAGGLSFGRVSAGVFHTCGQTTNNLAYCWGSNTYGGVGDGTSSNQRLRPVPVSGGLRFSQVSAGGFNSCGVTPGAVGYCWGYNFGGALGDGTRTDRSVPVPVADP